MILIRFNRGFRAASCSAVDISTGQAYAAGMLKRLLALLSALTLFTGGLLLASSPAQAASLHNCPDDRVCLYQWLNYGAPAGDANPGWKSTFLNIWNHGNHCVNLDTPMAYWPNGTEVRDNSAGLVINNATWSQYYVVSVYGWAGCNSSGGISSYTLIGDTAEPDLRNVPMDGTHSAYHYIYSIGMHLSSCPPSGC